MNTIHNTSKTRIFENPFLEALTKTSPTITLVFYSTLTITLITVGSFAAHPSVLRVALYFTCGLLFWSLFWIHHSPLLISYQRIYSRYRTLSIYHSRGVPRESQRWRMCFYAAGSGNNNRDDLTGNKLPHHGEEYLLFHRRNAHRLHDLCLHPLCCS